MKLIQKQYEEDGTYYFFHSVGKWFLLIKYDGFFDTELRYDFSEETLIGEQPFITTAEKEIKDVNGIGRIRYASFRNGKEKIVLLGIADVTLIAREEPEVSIEENAFDHYYGEYMKQYDPYEELVCINLPEDNATRITMLLDDFYDTVDAEYHFGMNRDIEFYRNLSAIRDCVRNGDVAGFLESLQIFIEEN